MHGMDMFLIGWVVVGIAGWLWSIGLTAAMDLSTVIMAVASIVLVAMFLMSYLVHPAGAFQ